MYSTVRGLAACGSFLYLTISAFKGPGRPEDRSIGEGVCLGICFYNCACAVNRFAGAFFAVLSLGLVFVHPRAVAHLALVRECSCRSLLLWRMNHSMLGTVTSIPEKFRKDERVCLAAFMHHPELLGQFDGQLFLRKVGEEWSRFLVLTSERQQDPAVIDAVLGSDSSTVVPRGKDVSAFWNHELMVLLAIGRCPGSFSSASERLKKSSDFCVQAARVHPSVVEFMSEDIRKNPSKELLDVTVGDGGGNIPALSLMYPAKFWANRELVLFAIRRNAEAFTHVIPDYQHHSVFIRDAVRANYGVLQYIPYGKEFNSGLFGPLKKPLSQEDAKNQASLSIAFGRVPMVTSGIAEQIRSLASGYFVSLLAPAFPSVAWRWAFGTNYSETIGLLSRDPGFWNVREAVLCVLERFPEHFTEISERLKNDVDCVLLGVRHSWKMLAFAGPEAKDDSRVLEAVFSPDGTDSFRGHALCYLSDKKKSDPDVVLKAMACTKSAIRFAADSLKNDSDFIRATMNDDNVFTVLEHIGPNLKLDRGLFFDAYCKTKGDDVFRFANPEILRDKQFVIDCVTQFPGVLRVLPDCFVNQRGLRVADREIIEAAALNYPREALSYASQEILRDRSFVLSALEKITDHPSFWSASFLTLPLHQNDQGIVTLAAQRGGPLNLCSNEVKDSEDLVMQFVRNVPPTHTEHLIDNVIAISGRLRNEERVADGLAESILSIFRQDDYYRLDRLRGWLPSSALKKLGVFC